MERKSAEFEIKRAPDSEGRFEGYAAVFNNVDSGGDVIAPGAFTKTLGRRMPKMLWQHDPREVIGKWESVEQDDNGLFVKGRVFQNIPRGAEALTLLKEGELDGMSIGYRTIKATDEGRQRKLIELDMWEVSLVTFPMNEKARVTAVKSINTERDFEQFLRDAGFSRKEAAAITLHGYKAKDGQRDAGSDDGVSEGAKALLEKLTNLKEAFNA